MSSPSIQPVPALPPRLAQSVLALVGTLVTASLIGSALAPVLLVKSPLLLVLLSPDARHVALSVGSVAPLPLVVLAVTRRAMFSVGSFGLGMIYGGTAVTWVERRSPRLGKLFRGLERLFGRWGAAILVILPFGSVCVLAGAARTGFAKFLAAIVLGHTLWVSSIYLIGELITDFTERLLAFLAAHPLESTLVCVVMVLVQQLFARRRARRTSSTKEPSS